jgi:hypothetical protein
MDNRPEYLYPLEPQMMKILVDGVVQERQIIRLALDPEWGYQPEPKLEEGEELFFTADGSCFIKTIVK